MSVNESQSPSSAITDQFASSCSLELPWSCLAGERLVDDSLKFSEVLIYVNGEPIRGKFFITNFRFYFTANSDITAGVALATLNDPSPTVKASSSSKANEKSNDGSINNTMSLTNGFSVVHVIDVPLGMIQRIERIMSSTAAQLNIVIGVSINCKNGRKLKFYKTNEDNHFEKQVYGYLNKYAFPLSNNLNYFAFDHKSSLPINDGWHVYKPEEEYARMGVSELKSKWRISHINAEYKFADTYPAALVVPAHISDKELELLAEFRSKSRIPVLSWLKRASCDNSNGSGGGCVAIVRSSQPMCGMSGKRNYWDESYLKSIADMNMLNGSSSSSSSSSSAASAAAVESGGKSLHILDARPYINALANCTTGGGYENEKCYTSCKLSFLNIENIHAMRDSLGASNDSRDFFTSLENSKWLDHIRLVLDGALRVVDLVDADCSILIHCSDGWDRTAQLTSLSMLILDKFYRTIRGFQVLIEKEWLSFGHRFGTRMGHGTDKYSDHDRSPIFLQFIDCVWQIMQQNQLIFEFNEHFLVTILSSMYTCQYGTFLMDSECEREKSKIKENTVSLWSFINSNLIDFRNSDFMEYDKSVKFSTTSLKLWTSYYFQYKDKQDSMSAPVDTTLQKSIDTVGNIFENITPNGFNFLSNGYKLFNHIKSNLRN